MTSFREQTRRRNTRLGRVLAAATATLCSVVVLSSVVGLALHYERDAAGAMAQAGAAATVAQAGLAARA